VVAQRFNEGHADATLQVRYPDDQGSSAPLSLFVVDKGVDSKARSAVGIKIGTMNERHFRGFPVPISLASHRRSLAQACGCVVAFAPKWRTRTCVFHGLAVQFAARSFPGDVVRRVDPCAASGGRSGSSAASRSGSRVRWRSKLTLRMMDHVLIGQCPPKRGDREGPQADCGLCRLVRSACRLGSQSCLQDAWGESHQSSGTRSG